VLFDTHVDCPNFKRFLQQILPVQSDRIAIQELLSSCLLRDYRYQLAYIFIGGGDNGKSTLLLVIVTFLGNDNVSHIDLYDIATNRFMAAELYHKLANIQNDLDPKELRTTGMFKALTGGDRVKAERKHRDPFFFINYAILVYSTNQVPVSRDTSDAFYRRWNIIKFTQQFKPELGNCNPTILEELTTPEELSGILNWALEGLHRIKAHGISNLHSVNDRKRVWRSLSDPLSAFVEERCSLDPGLSISKTEFYRALRRYCTDHDFHLPSMKNVGQRLPALYRQVRGGWTRQQRSWRGISLKVRL
jgi:putative DNA primase/helicase